MWTINLNAICVLVDEEVQSCVLKENSGHLHSSVGVSNSLRMAAACHAKETIADVYLKTSLLQGCNVGGGRVSR